LSDPGNAFAATNAISVPPFEPIPAAAYAIGKQHFTNGLTWVEQMAVDLGLKTSAGPAVRNPGTFSNYAFGGARARMDQGSPGLDSQVTRYLADFSGVAPSDALYVIFIGGNDLRDALEAYASDTSGTSSLMILQQALYQIGLSIQRLWWAGARSFLIANVPDIGLTPAVSGMGPGAQFLSQVLATTFNAYLESDVLAPAGAFPGISIARMDVFTALHAVAAAPQMAGLRNVAMPCLTFFSVTDPVCDRPDEYLFWDAIHPTRAGHTVLRNAAADALAAL